MELIEITMNADEQMQKTLDYTKTQIEKIRTGRASASLIDGVMVDAYGSSTPIGQTANVSSPDARSIIIQPWDRSLLEAIEKAIQTADLGFNPQNDGTIIRINVPPLTEERRKEFVKMAKKYAEDGKIAVRNIRRDNNELLRKAEKSKELSEDFRKQGEEEIQEITNGFIKNIDELASNKEKELLSDD